MHHNDNLEARKLISDAITALPPANVDLQCKDYQLFCVYKSNTVVVKTGYKWKIAHPLNLQLVRDSCILNIFKRSWGTNDKVYYVYDYVFISGRKTSAI
jgi:hypothetical protein